MEEVICKMWTYVSAHELYHHGIKGQKWGVRRFQNKDGSLTPAGRERYQDEELDDGTYILKKGSEVHRVTANPEGEKKGKAYISFMDADVKGYKHEITNWLKNSSDDGEYVQTYDMTMKVTKDLVLPSEMKKAETFVELMADQKVDFAPMYSLKLSYSDENGKFIGRPRKIVDALMKQGMDNETASAYTLFAMSLYTNDNNRDAFFNALKSKGYNAIEDLEDSYAHRMKPIIVFEREKTLKVVKWDALPNPEIDPDGWEQIVDDATEAVTETNEYHKKKGIK